MPAARVTSSRPARSVPQALRRHGADMEQLAGALRGVDVFDTRSEAHLHGRTHDLIAERIGDAAREARVLADELEERTERTRAHRSAASSLLTLVGILVMLRRRR